MATGSEKPPRAARTRARWGIALGAAGAGVLALGLAYMTTLAGAGGQEGGVSPEERAESGAAAGDGPGAAGGQTGAGARAERGWSYEIFRPFRRDGDGEHKLAGEVLDLAGEGISGARVSAFRLGGEDAPDDGEDAGGEGQRASAAGAGAEEAGEESAAGAGAEEAGEEGAAGAGASADAATPRAVYNTTGEGGAFELHGLEEGRYRVTVAGRGVIDSTAGVVRAPGEDVRVLAPRRVAIAGRARAGGEAAAGAAVILTDERGARRGEIRADPMGRFVFDDIPEGRYLVHARDEDLASPAATAARLGAGPHDDVELELTPAASVSGRAIDAGTGEGIPAVITLRSEDGEPDRRLWSDGSGRFEARGLLPGTWSARARAPGYRAAAETSLELEPRPEPEAEAEIEIALRPGATVEGVVRDASGRPAQAVAVSVVAMDAGDDGAGAGALSTTPVGGRGLGLSGASGAVDRGAGSGISASAGDGPVLAGSDPRFEPVGDLGILRGPIPYPPVEPGQVEVALPAGAAAASSGRESEAPPPALAIPRERVSAPVTGEEGRFRLTGLNAGRHRLVASPLEGPAVGSEPIDLEAGEARTGIELSLAPGAPITGVVESSRTGRLEGAEVIAEPAVEGLPTARAETDRRGRFELGPLAGEVSLIVRAAGYSPVSRTVEVDPSEGASARGGGRERFELVPADGAIAGAVRAPHGSPIEGAEVVAFPEGTGARRAVTDADGRFEITSLPRGVHQLRIEPAAYPPFETRGAVGERLAIDLEAGGGIAGAVIDAHTSRGVATTVRARGPGGEAREVESGPDGAFEIAPIRAGSWELSADASGYAPVAAEVEVEPARRAGRVTARGARLELERGARLSGIVRDESGRRVAGARVMAGGRSAEADEDGRFDLDQVPVGETELRAEKGDAAGGRVLTLRPGDERLTLDLRVSAGARDR